MKKRKIFLLPILLFALAACSNGEASSEPAKSGEQPAQTSQKAGSSSAAHKHSWGEWSQTQAPTCEGKGKEERVCSECNEKETRDVAATGHKYNNGVPTTPATCTTPGVKTFTCTVCGNTKTEAIPAGHNFSNEETVAGDTEHVGYKKAECSKGDAVQIKIHAVDGKLQGQSKIKSGTPEGWMKLNSTGHKIAWNINIAGDTGYKGTLYQRGYMDSFSSNTEKGYSWVSSSNDTKEPVKGNFDVVVNGESVDKTAMMDKTFTQMTDGGEENNVDSSGSPIGLCEIGPAYLKAGENVITYERLGSYNLIISDIIFVGEAHNHDFSDGWVVKTPATESAEGLQERVCKTCGLQQSYVIPKLEGYNVTFVPEHCKIMVFDSQDYTATPVETNTAKTRDADGVLCKYFVGDVDLGIDEVKPQINFQIVPDAGYKIDGDQIVISGTKGTEWNNIKAQKDGIYRITVIKADLTINVSCVLDGGEPEAPGFEIKFNLSHCTVKVYVGKKDETGSNIDAGPNFYSRLKDAPYDYSNDGGAEPQFNFEVVPEAGYQFDSGVAVGGEAKASAISFITGTYNKLKNLGDNVYNITKIAGNLTITITCTPVA